MFSIIAFIILLVFILFVGGVTNEIINEIINSKFKTSRGFIRSILYILLPVIIPLISVFYAFGLAILFGKSYVWANNWYMWSMIAMLIIMILLMIGSFSPTHTKKDGTADKRYKNNPTMDEPMGWFFLGLLVLVGIYHYIGIKPIDFFEFIFIK